MSSEATQKYVAWNSDVDYALGLCKLNSQLLGIWPFECQSLFSKIRSVVAFISQVILIAHCIREIGGTCVEPEDVVNFVGGLGPCILVTIKITVLRVNNSQMELVIRSITDDWAKEDGPRARKIMRSYASLGRTVSICDMTFTVLVIALYIFISLLKLARGEAATNGSPSGAYNVNFTTAGLSDVTARTLPMGTDCFVADLPTSLYATYYVFQIVQLGFMAAGNVGNDLYFLCITMHVCGQFEVLKERLEQFGAKQDVPNCRAELGRLVRRYNHLIVLANYFEDIFNPIIFAILTANTVQISLLGLQVVICMNEGDVAKVTQGMVAIKLLSLQLFLYCYAGQCLSSQDENIRNAAYNCRWYDLPPTIVRDIIIVIMNSGSEFQLTAGKIFQMNFNNFKAIMKSLFSYFSMLRIMLNM